MAKGTVIAILVGLLGSGVIRLVWAGRGGASYADAIGITLTSVALLGFVFLLARRVDK